MANKTEYIVVPNKNLIIEYYSGKFHVNELIAFKEAICSDKNYNPNFNIINDFREAEFLFEIDEISKYTQFILETRKNYGHRKSTMITKTPNQVVTSLGFEMLKKNIPISVKVVSTIEAAIDFIELSLKDKTIIETCIKQMKHK